MHKLMGSLTVVGLCLTTITANASPSAQSTSLQSTSLQSTSLQSTSLQSTSLQSTSLQSTSLQSTSLQSTSLQGTALIGGWLWEPALGYYTYRYPNYYYKYANNIWSGPYYDKGMAGAYITGTLSNGMSIQLYISRVEKDTTQNSMASSSYRSNSDIYLYEVLAKVDQGWVYACSPDAQGKRMGTFVAGTWDTRGLKSESGVTFACNTGVIAKCMRSWGYKPWKTLNDSAGRPHSMARFHEACTRAARADYGGIGVSFTRDGTMVDLYDNFGFNTKVAETAQHGMFVTEAYFGSYNNQPSYGAYMLGYTRYKDTDSDNIGPKAVGSLDTDNDGVPDMNISPSEFDGSAGTSIVDVFLALIFYTMWDPAKQQASYDSNMRSIAVETSAYCPHNTVIAGAPMNPACNACTQAIYNVDPYCGTNWWDQICVDEVRSGSFCSYSQSQGSNPY